MAFILDKISNEKITLNNSWTNVGNVAEADIIISASESFLFTIEKIADCFFIESKKGDLTLNNLSFSRQKLEDGSEIKICNTVLNFFAEIPEAFQSEIISELQFIDQEEKEFINSLISLNNFASQLNRLSGIDSLLNAILRLAMPIVSAKKAFIMLNEEREKLIPSLKATVNLDPELKNLEVFLDYLEKFIKDSEQKEQKIYFQKINLNNYPQLKNVLLIVLKFQNRIIGYLGFFNLNEKKELNERDGYLLNTLGEHSVIAVAKTLDREKTEAEERFRSNLQKNFSRSVIEKLLKNPDLLALSGKKNTVVVLALKIKCLSEFSEKQTPEKLLEMLNQLLPEIKRVIFSFDGTIEQLSTGNLLAVFGLPFSGENLNLNAVKTAFKIKEVFKQLKEEQLFNNLDLCFGLSYGDVIYGNTASPGRVELKIIGKTVEEAFSLSDKAEADEILISEKVMEEIKEKIRCEKRGILADRSFYQAFSENQELLENVSDQSRKFVRIAVKTFVTVIKDNIRTHGLIRDISQGGVKIALAGRFNPKDRVSLTFLLGNRHSFRNISGLVKHIEKQELNLAGIKDNKPLVILGIEFEALEPEVLAKITEFMNEEKKRQLKVFSG